MNSVAVVADPAVVAAVLHRLRERRVLVDAVARRAGLVRRPCARAGPAARRWRARLGPRLVADQAVVLVEARVAGRRLARGCPWCGTRCSRASRAAGGAMTGIGLVPIVPEIGGVAGLAVGVGRHLDADRRQGHGETGARPAGVGAGVGSTTAEAPVMSGTADDHEERADDEDAEREERRRDAEPVARRARHHDSAPATPVTAGVARAGSTTATVAAGSSAPCSCSGASRRRARGRASSHGKLQNTWCRPRPCPGTARQACRRRP